MSKEKIRRRMSLIRHRRIRARMHGSAERPRLAIFRSAKHIYAQVIDDAAGHTLAAAGTLDKALKAELQDKNPMETAAAVGVAIAKRALDQGIKQVVFDRGGFKYHGRVKALADSARETGLEF